MSKKIKNYTSTRHILGWNFISPREITIRSRGRFKYAPAQLDMFLSTLPSLEIQKWCYRNNFILIPDPPMDMSLFSLFEKNLLVGTWLAEEGQTFVHNDLVRCEWLMLRRGLVPNSTNLPWSEQIKIIGKDEMVPNITEMFWGFLTYSKIRGVALLPSVCGCTSSIDASGNHVHILGDEEGTLPKDINAFDDDSYSNLGICSKRNLS